MVVFENIIFLYIKQIKFRTMKIRRLNTLLVIAITCLSLISFNSCKKKDVEDEIRPLKASFAEGTNTDGYVLVIKGDVMNIYKSYEAINNRISVVIEKDSDEVLKVDGLIQNSNEVVLNTDIVCAKNKDKVAEYDIQIDDFKYKIKVSYQYSNFDKAIDLIKDKRFVYYDLDISQMPSHSTLTNMSKHLKEIFTQNKDKKTLQYLKLLFGEDIMYPSNQLPDVSISKENYLTFIKNVINAELTQTTNSMFLSDFCPFYLSIKTSNIIEVQHLALYDDKTVTLADYQYTYKNIAYDENNNEVFFDNYIDFEYSLEKLDDNNIIIKIEDKNLCSLGNIPSDRKGYYDWSYSYKADKDDQTYHLNSFAVRTNKQKDNYKGYRLVGDNYTNIIINIETGLISYEIDIHSGKEYNEKERMIIYLKAE